MYIFNLIVNNVMKKAMVYWDKTNKDQVINTVHQNSNTILATYDQSILIEADDSSLEKLQNKGFRVRQIPDSPIVEVRGYKVNTSLPEIRTASASLSADMIHPSGLSHHILHLIGPLLPDWKKQLEHLGVIFRQSLAQENYYLISVNINNINNVQQLPFVESLVPYYPTLKINASLLTPEIHMQMHTIDAIMPINPLSKEKQQDVNTSRSKLSNSKIPTEISNKINHNSQDIDIEKEGNLEILIFDQKIRNMLLILYII